MDDLSPVECVGGCESGIQRWDGLLDHGDGIVRGIFPVRRIELHNHDSQYAHEGHEYDQAAAYDLGALLYRDPGRTFFPCASFRPVSYTHLRAHETDSYL